MVALFALLPFVGLLASASPLIQRADNSTTIGQRIHCKPHHSVNADEWCVTAGNGNAAKRAPINIAYCFDDCSDWVEEQLWTAPEVGTPGSIALHSDLGTALCLTALGPHDQQTWTLTSSDQIVLEGTDLCLDVDVASNQTNQNPYVILKDLQVSDCAEDSDSQKFTLI
ncbi:hypothetical protein I350_06542 [Cryptococcus amylolentus CBS 6273]|uniref:Uncharacterized protein n=1 Tax=Cryptococcus amylolentus CBS 6273 TaxID=1296118 RepID=A0A1E3JM33_9TREE|nr:hypothetical protein I350_06542 [Cryptococcus amylolentus CBS 6273]